MRKNVKYVRVSSVTYYLTFTSNSLWYFCNVLFHFLQLKNSCTLILPVSQLFKHQNIKWMLSSCYILKPHTSLQLCVLLPFTCKFFLVSLQRICICVDLTRISLNCNVLMIKSFNALVISCMVNHRIRERLRLGETSGDHLVQSLKTI